MKPSEIKVGRDEGWNRRNYQSKYHYYIDAISICGRYYTLEDLERPDLFDDWDEYTKARVLCRRCVIKLQAHHEVKEPKGE